jgi:hypothetical protein
VGEAVAMAKNYDVPGVGSSELFWTDHFFNNGSTDLAVTVPESGTGFGYGPTNSPRPTVCVTDPSA